MGDGSRHSFAEAAPNRSGQAHGRPRRRLASAAAASTALLALFGLTGCGTGVQAATAERALTGIAAEDARALSADNRPPVSSNSSTPDEADVSAPAEQPGSAANALELLETVPVKGRAPKTGYDRDLFGHAWADVDRNGCDTRIICTSTTSHDVQALANAGGVGNFSI